jgi:hypothetical protein
LEYANGRYFISIFCKIYLIFIKFFKTKYDNTENVDGDADAPLNENEKA